MKVSPLEPFEVVYSLFQHEFLGYLFESFVVKSDTNRRFSFLNQNISSRNAKEFDHRLDATDYELINVIDSMQQDVVIKKFYKKKSKPEEFFHKIYHPEKGNKTLQQEIQHYLENRRAKVLSLISDKNLFEMGKDGEPTWKKINVQQEEATILFHFRRNEDNTHYFPTIKHKGAKVDFQYKNAILVCKSPAWLLLEGNLYHFHKNVDGQKLQPFLNKKFIVIPQKVEETYYKKFISTLVAQFDVFAKGFEIKIERKELKPVLCFSELIHAGTQAELFHNGSNGNHNGIDKKLLFELKFCYGNYSYNAGKTTTVNVELEKHGKDYTFYKIKRDSEAEKRIIAGLAEKGLSLKAGKYTVELTKGFSWINEHNEWLALHGIELHQKTCNGRKFFLGETVLDVKISDNIDWFDIEAIVRFGGYDIPFRQLRKLILNKQSEFPLPNGEIAIIPEHWTNQYAELFAFADDKDSTDHFKLKIHHLALVQELEQNNLAKVHINRKLEKLKEFDRIDDEPVPQLFQGELRPYQKAGFNWLRFLKKYNFGGCLADDMGLGKTIQTLALLQSEQENNGKNLCSLLIMPTSLIYNWLMEAEKFTPHLKILNYTGAARIKDVSTFSHYDLVITSYGITRLDIDLLEQFYFNYIILDESQAIKNPDSNIAKAVKKLHGKTRLILTGTPIENSMLDLWSQMTFINPGLLGNQKFFKNEFLQPIEKQHDELKIKRLNTIIKPFILRREKEQVATELPEKVENVQFVSMTAMQQEYYEKVKASFRNKILESIETKGLNNSSLILLKGLSQLRQIANHPKLVDSGYGGDSGKLEDVNHMLVSALGKDHNILIFSQFVRYLAIVEDTLKMRGIEYAYLDGSTRDRKGQVNRFLENDHVRVFLISLKAGGVGLNLTKADYVFILDPWWNPAVEAQAIDRAHRIGQQNTVFSYKFITKDTVEEKILALQARKLSLVSEFISSEGSFMKNLTKEDIARLFE